MAVVLVMRKSRVARLCENPHRAGACGKPLPVTAEERQRSGKRFPLRALSRIFASSGRLVLPEEFVIYRRP
jgi:hypothetical protein